MYRATGNVLATSEETRQAMLAAPDYWIRWYTFKSLALVAVVAAFSYTLGKHARRS